VLKGVNCQLLAKTQMLLFYYKQFRSEKHQNRCSQSDSALFEFVKSSDHTMFSPKSSCFSRLIDRISLFLLNHYFLKAVISNSSCYFRPMDYLKDPIYFVI